MSTKQSPLGQVIKFRHLPDGTSRVVLDNGPVSTITITCHAEQFPDLMASDLSAIREHLMTRKPGHFRKKRANH
jgi:hypothetical protein